MTNPAAARFRFAFSLRTLFVVLTIFGVWLGWQLKIVRERRAVLAAVGEQVGPSGIGLRWLEAVEVEGTLTFGKGRIDFQDRRVSRTRRLCGNQSCRKILVVRPDAHLLNRLERAFSEVELMYSLPEDGVFAKRDSIYKPRVERQPNRGNTFKTELIEK